MVLTQVMKIGAAAASAPALTLLGSLTTLVVHNLLVKPRPGHCLLQLLLEHHLLLVAACHRLLLLQMVQDRFPLQGQVPQLLLELQVLQVLLVELICHAVLE